MGTRYDKTASASDLEATLVVGNTTKRVLLQYYNTMKLLQMKKH